MNRCYSLLSQWKRMLSVATAACLGNNVALTNANLAAGASPAAA